MADTVKHPAPYSPQILAVMDAIERLGHDGRRAPAGLPIVDRLARRSVLSESPVRVEDAGPCFVWTGHCMKKGHGVISIDSRPKLAHRVAYSELVRTAPDDLMLHHRCENPPCWNPWHLEEIEPAAHTVHHHRTGYCRKEGHRMIGSNVRYEADGRRRCAICYATARGRPIDPRWVIDAAATERPHPAKFSAEIMAVLQAWVQMEAFWLDKPVTSLRILDPMAGVGGVHELPGETVGVELEPEWALAHPATRVGSCLALPFPQDSFDVICVSPVYGNRMSDSFEAKDTSKRISYKFALGRKPSEGSSATLHFGKEYRIFHMLAWAEVLRVLRPGGLFILNVSDFIKGGERVGVSAWHRSSLVSVLDFTLIAQRDVPTPRMRFGQNHAARVECEHVFAFRAPPT